MFEKNVNIEYRCGPDQSVDESCSALRRTSIVLRATAIPPKMSTTEMASSSPVNLSLRASMLSRCVLIKNSKPLSVIRIAVELHSSRRMFDAALVEKVILRPPEGGVASYATPHD
jgi:hypothetical protein